MQEVKDPSALERLYDDQEVADYLKLSPKSGRKTVQKWVREGKMTALRVGDLYRFRKSDIEAFTVLAK